jgi:Wax ester synthase-like Acyl-CoA acyltransferase domain
VEGLLHCGLALEKPPWELHVLSQYGRHLDTAVVVRVHQCLADGMALVRVLCHALSDTRVLHVPQKPHFGGLTFSVNAIRALLVGPATLCAWFLLARNSPRRSVVATAAARTHHWPQITISHADTDHPQVAIANLCKIYALIQHQISHSVFFAFKRS